MCVVAEGRDISGLSGIASFFSQEFLRRRPFSLNQAIRTPAGYRGDVQVTSFDGLNIVYNGAMEMLMAKGESVEPGVGFAMTALLQVRAEADSLNIWEYHSASIREQLASLSAGRQFAKSFLLVQMSARML